MADKKIIVEREDLSSLSSRIRTKTGSNAGSLVWPDGFIDAVDDIGTGVDVSNVTANASNIQSGYYTFDTNGELVQGTMPERTINTTDITTPSQTVSVQSGHYASNYTIGIPASARVNLDADHLLNSAQVLGVTGSILTQTPTNREIITANQAETISAGYYPSNFTVSIPASAKTGLDANKMLDSATILGVTGSIPTVTVSKNTLSSEEDSISIPAGYHASATNITIDTNNINDLDGNNILDSAEILGVQGTVPTISPSKEELTTTTDYATIPLGYNPTVKTITIASSAVSDLNSNNILAGKTILGVSGSIPTQSISNPIISAVSQSIPVPSGYYAFDTAISIKSEDQAKLIPENIKSGITVLSVTGNLEYSSFTNWLNRTIISASDDTVQRLYPNSFEDCSFLTTVDFPNCTTIDNNAFDKCTKLTTISFPNCTTIGNNAFYSCTSLTTINFSKCLTIGERAFYSCTKLTSINFPNCTTIRSSAFYNCTKLKSANFPNCISIYRAAFYSCTSLTTIDFPNCTKIESETFKNCTQLESANFPNCISIDWAAFYSCTSLTTIDFPNCTYIDEQAFMTCTKLQLANFPNCITIAPSAFAYCSSLKTLNLPNWSWSGYSSSYFSTIFQECKNLETAYFPKILTLDSKSGFLYHYNIQNITILGSSTSTIGSSTFHHCYNLLNLTILRSEGVAPLVATNAFNLTPISDYTTSTNMHGSIYVPASLVDAYKSATNWAVYANRITAIPEE